MNSKQFFSLFIFVCISILQLYAVKLNVNGLDPAILLAAEKAVERANRRVRIYSGRLEGEKYKALLLELEISDLSSERALLIADREKNKMESGVNSGNDFYKRKIGINRKRAHRRKAFLKKILSRSSKTALKLDAHFELLEKLKATQDAIASQVASN